MHFVHCNALFTSEKVQKQAHYLLLLKWRRPMSIFWQLRVPFNEYSPIHNLYSIKGVIVVVGG